jgi:SAM-dependent methyltransferase
VLEHVSDPLAILREAKRVLKKNGRLTVTEVHNPSLFVYPQSAALDAYWTAYNRLQVDLGGDPCIGPKLPNLGLRAGMQVARYGYIGPILDARAGTSQRAESVKFWIDLFCSARSRLEGEDRVTSDQVEETLAHLSSLEHNPESILHYTGCQIELKY